MLRIIHGDLLVSNEPAIAHGCNCKKVMGAGIAKLIALKYPGVRKADRAGIHSLGSFTWSDSDGPVVLNLYTQISTGATFIPEALRQALDSAILFLEFRGIYSIGLPWIGCGIGGCSRATVKSILDDIAGKHPATRITVYELD